MEPGTSKQAADLEPIVSPCGKFARSSTIIDSGGSKIVFEGHSLKENCRYSVAWCETLKSDLVDRKILREESKILRQLNHPNIVRHIAFWDSDIRGHSVLITELMELGSLQSYRKSLKSIDKKTYTHWSFQIIRGIDYLHTHDPVIIHRDIKCGNILVSGSPERLKICDFGLAKRKSIKSGNFVCGTPPFMAPEIYSKDYDEFVDIYAFGMCMLEMITGTLPYQECRDKKQIKQKVLNGEKPKSFSQIQDRYTRNLIEWCIDARPMLRPTSLQIVNMMFFEKMGPFKGLDELLGPSAEEPLSPPPSLTNQIPPKKARKRRAKGKAKSGGATEKPQQNLTVPKKGRRPKK